MRILTLLGVLGLASSAYFAPRHFEGRSAISEAGLISTDGKELLAMGNGPARALGTGYAGAMLENDIGQRFRFAMRLWGVAPSTEGLPKVVAGEIASYLAAKDRIDPDGDVLRSALEDWCLMRFANKDFMMQLSPALWMAARGDERGKQMVRGFIEQGPFHEILFPNVHMVHPRWEGIEDVVVHYLEKGDLSGRVWAASVLLYYNGIWRIGEQLLEKHRARIVRDLNEALTIHKHALEYRVAWRAVLPCLAMIGKEGADILRRISDPVAGQSVDFVRAARIWAGVAPFKSIRLGGPRWELFQAKSWFFKAGVYRYAILARAAKAARAPRESRELRAAREVAENALHSTDATIRYGAFAGLVAQGGKWAKELPPRLHKAGGLDSLYASATVATETTPDFLLRWVASPTHEYAGLAVVTLLYKDRPLPLQGP